MGFPVALNGVTTFGLIATHLIPSAIDVGMEATAAALLLTIIGGCNLIGTAIAGAITDRMQAKGLKLKWLLFFYFFLRGVLFFALPRVMGPLLEWKVIVLVVLIGFDFLAVVPPMLALCNQTWGDQIGPAMFGWMFALHQLGAAAGALVPGNIRDAFGSYDSAWTLACILCFVGAFQIAFVPTPSKSTEMM